MLIIVTVVNTSAGIWALVRHEQVDLLPLAHLEQAFSLAVSDEKPLWDRMHSKVILRKHLLISNIVTEKDMYFFFSYTAVE